MKIQDRPIIIDNRNIREDVPEINEYFEKAKEETENIPKVNNIVVDEKYVENVNCSVCGADESKQLLVKRGFVYVVCEQCGHVYLKNRMREEILLDLYKNAEIDAIDRKTHESPYHVEFWQKVHGKYIDMLMNSGISNNNLIDVGSGDGRFLKYCKNNINLTLHANDYCSDNYEYIVDLVGKDSYYYEKTLNDIDFGSKKFGIITLWGVLEHLPNPVDILKKCHEIMDDDSKLLILIPNIYSRAFKILGVNVPTLNPRQHINFYTKESMQYLCNETGFVLTGDYQELPVIDLMYPYIDYSEKLIEEIVDADESYNKVYILTKA